MTDGNQKVSLNLLCFIYPTPKVYLRSINGVRRCLGAGRPLICYPAWEIEVNEFQLSEEILAKVAKACMPELSASTVDGVTKASLGYVHMPTLSVLQFGESSFSGECELSSKAVS